jgi:hypothetical protein
VLEMSATPLSGDADILLAPGYMKRRQRWLGPTAMNTLRFEVGPNIRIVLSITGTAAQSQFLIRIASAFLSRWLAGLIW